MKDEAVNPIIRNFVRDQKDVKIDRYSDKGAYGELYFGERVVFGDRVALKFYELDDNGNGHEEAKLLKEISHDNILPIIDARIIDDKVAYYLTPEMSGGDLQNVIDKYIIPTDKGITIIRNILEGLSELHKSPNNMVHRDLKTFNILVDISNEVKTYLADFGTIKKINSSATSTTASKFTILYRTPEALSSNIHSYQSDIYQVGIILFQVLGGFFPMKNPELWLKGRSKKKFRELERWQQQGFLVNYINDLISKGKLLDLSSLPSYVNRKLKTVIRTATRTDPTNRYQTCSGFLKALYDAVQQEKNWWLDNDTIYCECPKKGNLYRIVKRKDDLITEWSRDKGTTWRKKFDGTKQEMIKKITAHNKG